MTRRHGTIIWGFVGLAGLLAVGAGGCSGSVPAANPPSTASISPAAPALPPGERKSRGVKIALLLPLAGMDGTAQVARGMKQAAELALFERNDPAIQLVTKDDGGTPEGARAAAEAATADGAQIILGPLLSKSAAAVAPAARKASVPVVAFSNDPSAAGNGVYLMSYFATEEVERVIAFAASKGKRRYTALIPATPYGQMVEPVFRAAVAKSGGEVVRLETLPGDGKGMLAAANTILQTIRDAEKAGTPVDALFVPAGPDTLTALAPLLTFEGIDPSKVKLIGTSAWDLPLIARDDVLVGGWYAASDPAGWTEFAEKYRKTFGTTPPRLATLAYDAVNMAISLSGSGQPEPFSTANLTRAEGFTGVDGPVRLLPSGLSARGLAVLEIEKYRSVVIDPAPASGEPGKISSAGGTPRLFQ